MQKTSQMISFMVLLVVVSTIHMAQAGGQQTYCDYRTLRDCCNPNPCRRHHDDDPDGHPHPRPDLYHACGDCLGCFAQCDLAGNCFAKRCPAAVADGDHPHPGPGDVLAFNPRIDVCDWPRNVYGCRPH